MTPEERHRFLANMRDDAGRLSRLVSRLMSLAQADMRGGEVVEPADATSILARLADAESGQGFRVEVSVTPGLPLLDIEDAALETVLTTLIENARQAGATVVDIDTHADRYTGNVEVSDNGQGIAPGDRERIFEPFFTSKREQGGTGLGLSIAHALVLNRGGALDLVDCDRGSRFSIVLPINERSAGSA